MANQYFGSFEHRVQERFNCSAESLLSQFVEEGLTYDEAQDRIGITHGTIRKWAKKYDLELRSPIERSRHHDNEPLKLFDSKEINSHNFLSRSWSTTGKEVIH